MTFIFRVFRFSSRFRTFRENLTVNLIAYATRLFEETIEIDARISNGRLKFHRVDSELPMDVRVRNKRSFVGKKRRVIEEIVRLTYTCRVYEKLFHRKSYVIQFRRGVSDRWTFRDILFRRGFS